MPLTEHVDWIPADIAAQTMCDILMTKDSGLYAVYNIINPHPVPWSRLVQMLRNCNVFPAAVKEVSLNKWIEILSTLSKGTEPPIPGLRLLAVFEAVDNNGWNSNEFTTNKAAGASNAFKECQEFQESWLQLSIQRWRDSSLLPEPVQAAS